MKTIRLFKNRIIATGAVLLILLLIPCAASAVSVNFSFTVPPVPAPPLISDISNSYLYMGSTTTFQVTAKLTGQLQQRPQCNKPNKADCTLTDWHFIDDPGVSPNPPDIKAAKVYYYLNDDVQSAASVNMALAPELGGNIWKASISLTGYTGGVDTVTFYFTAIDSRGNVASQVPDTGTVNQTCPSSPTGWNTEYQTPVTNSCAYMTSYTKCGVGYTVPPDPAPICPATYTVNDLDNNVCGEPNPSGIQALISLPKQDIKGFSAAADSTNLCINMGLGAAPPDPTDPSPIESYLAVIYNPDIYDENPADPWIKNAYAITFAPEIVGTDPSLVRTFWDVDCLTDPNTPNILDCKYITNWDSDPRLQIGYNGSLKFIVKRAGTGDPLAVPWSLIGSMSKSAYIQVVTEEINLAGGTANWISDISPAMTFYNKNQVIMTADQCYRPSPPIVTSTRCSADGTGGTGNACGNITPVPAQNICTINLAPSLDNGLVNEYWIYRNSTDSATGALHIGAIPASATATAYTFQDTHPSTEFNGGTYYYFITSYNPSFYNPACGEILSRATSKTNCTVMDTVPPLQPTINRAVTPAGTDKRCSLDFFLPAPDPSIKSFFMMRDGTALNYANPMNADPATTTYRWTDPTALTLGTSYSYTVTATDQGDNTNTSATATCTPEDLKPPAGINSLIGSNLSGMLGIRLEWNASPESDIAGYNAYICSQINPSTSCKVFDGQFQKMNTGGLITSTFFENNSSLFFSDEGDKCYYVESCDNCDTAGTCPSNPGVSPNCSGFPAGGSNNPMYVKCLTIEIPMDADKPAFPINVSATAPPEGGKCRLTWHKNYKQSNGTDFGNQINPSPQDLIGYKIMRGDGGAEPPTPAQAPAVGLVTINSALPLEFTDSTIQNGQSYKYAVYSIDGSANHSENGPGGNISIVTCTPDETMPPATPTMNPSGYTPTSCSPSWQPVNEPGVSYNLYKCTGDASVCNSANKFGLLNISDGCVRAATGTTCVDNDTTPDVTYRYCVTAMDPEGHETGIYPVGLQPNCANCTPTSRPKAVTGVNVLFPDDYCNTVNMQVYWTKSPDDTQSSSAGYNIFRCADADCATKTKSKSCSELKANSSQIINISATSPIVISPSPAGQWYYGVTFQSDCTDTFTESFLTQSSITSTSPVLPICLPVSCADPARCIQISSCSDPIARTGCTPLMQIDTSAGYPAAHTGFPTSPMSGASVYLLAGNGSPVDGPIPIGADGNFKIQIDNSSGAFNLADKYTLVMKIPAAQAANIPCDNSLLPPSFVGSDCGVIIKDNITLTQGAATTKVPLITIPAPGGGRSEIANPNCDNTIDSDDFLILRNSYGKNVGPGQDDAKPYADFNGDGTVDSADFLILRQNYNRTLPSTPTIVPDLCKQ